MDSHLAEQLTRYRNWTLVQPEWLDNPVRKVLLPLMTTGKAPSYDEAEAAMDEVCRFYAGQQTRATLEQIITLSAAIAMRSLSAETLAGLITATLRWQTRVRLRSEDAICASGMGGDLFKTVNVSSPACVVSSAAGARVAKHGARAATGLTGSSDWFELAGVNVHAPTEVMLGACDELKLGYFEFTRYCDAGLLTFKTLLPGIFHIIAPLTHPCDIRGKVCGANSTEWQDMAGEALVLLIQRGVLRHDFQALLVAGLDEEGRPVLDEISSFGPTRIVEVKNGEVLRYTLSPEDLGLRTSAREAVRARATREENVEATLRVLRGEERGPVRDIIVLNAAAHLYVARVAPTLAQGAQLAAEAISSGAAQRRLEQLAAASHA